MSLHRRNSSQPTLTNHDNRFLGLRRLPARAHEPVKVLAGDIGGTTTRLAIAEAGVGLPILLLEREYDSDAHDGLESIVDQFLNQVASAPPEASCFAVAGPVRGNQARITNLPWIVDAGSLQTRFDIGRVSLINDLQAVCTAIPHLGPADLQTLQEGAGVEHGVRAVIGAGTGLGEGFLVWNGKDYDSFPSEGGHVDFAPRSPRQSALLDYLNQRHDHASYERVLSGPGLETIYAFLRGDSAARTKAAEISEHAMEGSDAVAGAALDLFVEIYGAQAGNLALTCLATGGVYIAGGIAPKILPKLTEGDRFVRAFRDKGRMHPLLEAIPVAVVTHPEPGLIGAAIAAAKA